VSIREGSGSGSGGGKKGAFPVFGGREKHQGRQGQSDQVLRSGLGGPWALGRPGKLHRASVEGRAFKLKTKKGVMVEDVRQGEDATRY